MKIVAISLLITVILPHLSVAADCAGGAPIGTAMKLQDIAPELNKRADSLIAWWGEGRERADLSKDLIERQTKIDSIYSEIEAERTKYYSSLSCTVTDTKKCASTPGNKNKCPMSVSAPTSETEFVAAQIQLIGDDFESPPTLNGNTISYTVKKTGRGSNTGGFTAPVVYKKGKVNALVASEMVAVKQYFDAKVALTSTQYQNNSGTVTEKTKCTNLSGELLKLSELQKSGSLSDENYANAVKATIKACE